MYGHQADVRVMRHDDLAVEQSLVHQIRQRNEAAFSRLIDLYQGRVLRFVQRMVRDQEDALDITQEVFIRAYQSMDRFDGRASMRTWLFRIAHNLCIDRARKLQRTVRSTSFDLGQETGDDWEVPDDTWNPERAILSEEMGSVIEHAIANMSEKLRVVLVLHDKEEMAYEEIATTIDVPVGTVKSRLFLAREQLQIAVGKYVKSQEGWA